MESTSKIALSIVKEQVNSPGFDKTNIIDGRAKISFKILNVLGISESAMITVLFRRFLYRDARPKVYYKAGPMPLNWRQADLIKNTIIDKAIHNALCFDNSDTGVVALPIIAQGTKKVTDMHFEVNQEEIIGNLVTVKTNGKFPKSEIARRVSLLKNFTEVDGNSADLYEGSERRIFEDFFKLNEENQDRVISNLTRQLTPAL